MSSLSPRFLSPVPIASMALTCLCLFVAFACRRCLSLVLYLRLAGCRTDHTDGFQTGRRMSRHRLSLLDRLSFPVYQSSSLSAAMFSCSFSNDVTRCTRGCALVFAATKAHCCTPVARESPLLPPIWLLWRIKAYPSKDLASPPFLAPHHSKRPFFLLCPSFAGHRRLDRACGGLAGAVPCSAATRHLALDRHA